MDYTIEELLEIWVFDAESEKPHPGWGIVAMLEQGEFGRHGGTTCHVRAGVSGTDRLESLSQTCIEEAFRLLSSGPKSRLESFPVPVVKAEVTPYANHYGDEPIEDGDINVGDIAESLSQSVIDWFLTQAGGVQSGGYTFDSGAALCGSSTSRFVYWAKDANRFSHDLDDLQRAVQRWIEQNTA